MTAPERETIILLDDASGIATISTHQRPMLTKLRKNPAAREVEDLTHGSSPGARFEIPASLISIRTKSRTGGKGNPEALAKARASRTV